MYARVSFYVLCRVEFLKQPKHHDVSRVAMRIYGVCAFSNVHGGNIEVTKN